VLSACFAVVPTTGMLGRRVSRVLWQKASTNETSVRHWEESVMSSKEAYQRKLEGKLKEWKADFDKLKAKAEQSSGDAQLDYEKQLKSLKHRRDAVEERLAELREASESAWEDVKHRAEDAWGAMEDALSSARDRFK
jgi:hypothetical protein